MPVLYRASAGYLIRHPWQLALAVLGICIGVAVMVAVDLANQSSRSAFLLSMDALNGQATHQIVAGPGGIDEDIYRVLKVEHGLRNVAPVVTGYVTIADRSFQLLGVDVFAERDFRSFTTRADIETDLEGDYSNGRTDAEGVARQLLTKSGAVLMSGQVAADIGLKAGEPFEVFVNGKTYPATLAAGFRNDDSAGNGDLLVVDIAVAQHWLAMYGRLSRIDVRLAPDELDAMAAMRSLLPPGTQLLSASGRTQTTVDMSRAFMTNLSAMSLLALLVGLFLIYNSVAFAVLQRRDLIGILRALGVTRGQTLSLILVEASVIGAIGSSLGVLTGIWLGEKLLILVARTVSDHYFFVNVTSLTVEPGSVAKGLAAGFIATLVAAAVPALEASGMRPRLAMTRSVIEEVTGKLLPGLAVAGCTLMSIAAALVSLSGANLEAGLTALFMLILGFALCVPLLVGWASHALTPVAGRIGGTAGRLAIGGVGRSLSRTGVAVVALAIAVSATIGVSVMVGSFRVSVGEWLSNSLRSDIYVGVPRGALDAELLEDLVAAPGIAEYSTSRRTWLESDYGRVKVIAIDMAAGSYAGTRLRHNDPVSAWAQFDHFSAVLVSDSFAYRHSIQAGDGITLNTVRGPTPLAVAAVYQSYDANTGAIMMSRGTYDRLFEDDRIDSIGLYLADGVNPDDVMARLRTIADARQTLAMSSRTRIRELSLNIFDRTFIITNVLYWLAVCVAVIGIFDAMLALQLERVREFGILRALGMTPVQTAALVSLQAGFIGLLAGVVAIPLGLIMAWMLIEVINRRAFGWEIDMTVTVDPLAWAVVLAVGAALIGSIYPAWHAAVTRPALTMREE